MDVEGERGQGCPWGGSRPSDAARRRAGRREPESEPCRPSAVLRGVGCRAAPSEGMHGRRGVDLSRYSAKLEVTAPGTGTYGRRGVHVPIAQLDRALDCGSKGRRFESSWARRIPGEGSGRLRATACIADLHPSRVSERCESGRIGRSRKPLSRLRLRGFESHSLREVFFGDKAPQPTPGHWVARISRRVFAWRDDRVAEGARLEGVCTRKGTVGSNPTLSVQPLWR